MIIAQRTYKHKVLLLMKVGLAVFMIVIFLAQNAQTGMFEAKNFAYKKLNANEAQYFLTQLNALPEGGSGTISETSNLNIEAISAQVVEHIKNTVEPLLLKEASYTSLSTPLFREHRSYNNLILYSILVGVLALILIENQKIIFKTNKSLRLKQILNRISPRSPNSL